MAQTYSIEYYFSCCLFFRTDFLITASCDGHVKFWKKTEELIEFVKHFRSHLTPIIDLTDNYNGTLMCTISSDQTVKVFDVINFGTSEASAITQKN